MDSMKLIEKKFEAMGARVKITDIRNPRLQPTGFTISVGNDRKGEFFDVNLGENPIEILVVDCRPDDRHLLILVKSGEAFKDLIDRDNWSKLLCGHDERHWFVAGVDSTAVNVAHAKEILKPSEVVDSEVGNKVNRRDRNRRKNAAFIRQGEWFFVPVPDMNIDENLILYKEPLRRGFGSKPHMVDEVYRCGGDTVYVCRRFPDGLTETQYHKLLFDEPESKKLYWQVMSREPEVYARGYVRHPDHKTVELKDWHRVFVSNEVSGGGIVTNAFLD